MHESPDEPDRVFLRAAGGEAGAMDEAIAAVYEELRHLAQREARCAHDRIVQPTALVHETYLRLRQQRSGGWRDRRSFLAIAARVMRRVLVDQARGARRLRRGDGRAHEELEETQLFVADTTIGVLEVDDLLARLAVIAPDEAQVAELLVFGGLTVPEAARVTGVSARTVDRQWSFARAWLVREVERAEQRATGP